MEWSRSVAGLDLSHHQLQQLRTYVDLLLFWNRRIALVSQDDIGSILAKHVADSLFAAAHCGGAASIADLGSGAGFPGIPIAIARADARLCLIESRRKKASFLEEAVRSTDLRNCEVFEGRIEAAIERYSESFDLAVFRALAPTSRLLSMATSLVRKEGRVLAMLTKGAAQSRSAEKCVDYSLPDGTVRELAVFSV